MIEVTDEDVAAVEAIIGMDSGAWGYVEPTKIIAAAWEVMSRKQPPKDELAEAVKEAVKDDCGIECFEINGLVFIQIYRHGRRVSRNVSFNDNFPTLAAAAVRDLSRQVRR